MQEWVDCPDAEDHGYPFHCGRPIDGHPAWDCPKCEGAGTVATHPEPQKVDAPGAFIEVQPATGAVSIYAYDSGDGYIVSAADAFETAMTLARAAISAGHEPPTSFSFPQAVGEVVVDDVVRTEPPWVELDPGIVETVRLLWDAGFQPTDSGDGMSKVGSGMEGVLPMPHVAIRVRRPIDLVGETTRAIEVLRNAGYDLDPIAGWRVEGSFDGEVAIVMVYGPEASCG